MSGAYEGDIKYDFALCNDYLYVDNLAKHFANGRIVQLVVIGHVRTVCVLRRDLCLVLFFWL